MSQHVGYERKGAIGIITIDNPPVNALSARAPGHGARADARAGDEEAKALIVIGGGRTSSPAPKSRNSASAAEPPDPCRRTRDRGKADHRGDPRHRAGRRARSGARLPLPRRAATAQLGLPEVKLGICRAPAARSACRASIGAKPALDMITTGDFIRAGKARELGIIDEIVEGELLEGATALCRECRGAQGTAGRRLRERDDKIAEARGNDGLFRDYRAAVQKRARGQISPLRCHRRGRGRGHICRLPKG